MWVQQSLHELARLYIEQRFITDEEADGFLTSIPVLGDRDTDPQVYIPICECLYLCVSDCRWCMCMCELCVVVCMCVYELCVCLCASVH